MNTHNLLNTNSYHAPFGSEMPTRSFSSGDYRYGFNGMEKLEGFNQEGNVMDFGARIYDGRIGKFFSRDPLEDEYAWQTPYAYFKNSPISIIDWKGLGKEPDAPTKQTVKKGDNLTKIAKQNNTTVENLTEWNNIDNPDLIKPGQVLTVSDPTEYNEFANQTFGEYINSSESAKEFSGDQSTYEKIGEERDELVSQAIKEYFSPEIVGTTLLLYNPAKLPTTRGSALFAKNIPLVRKAYVEAVGSLKGTGEALLKKGYSKEMTARILNAQRRYLGRIYKAVTPEAELKVIEARNLKAYGDKLGPTIKWLRNQGKSWEQIIESSSRAGGKDLGF